MSDYYQNIDRGWLDYDLQSVEGISDLRFRGPAVDLSQPYICCIGAAQTFGRFCEQPFSTILSKRLGIQVLNLGVGGVGPRFFDTPVYLRLLNQAKFVIVQVLSGRSEGNSLFDNTQTASLMGRRLRDGKEMRFEEFFDDLVNAGDRQTIEQVIAETRQNYLENSLLLLDHIKCPKILFWFSNRTPAYKPDLSSFWGILGEFPHLVDWPMVNRMKPHADAYIECVSTGGIPQRLWPANASIEGADLEDEVLVNRYYPSPQMHEEAADLLDPVCRQFLMALEPRPMSVSPGGPARFVVLTGHRTGSTLLANLLQQHPDCFAGGELFNWDFMEDGIMPWPAETEIGSQDLISLRRADPVSFLKYLFQSVPEPVVGFKLMYTDGVLIPAVADYLAAEKTIRVIHLKRRNLLRRFLSQRRAEITGEWWKPIAEQNETRSAPIRLSFEECIADFTYIETQKAAYAERFSGHETLEIFYEDFVKDIRDTLDRVAVFLGLSAFGFELKIHSKEFAKDTLRDEIENYDDLKGQFDRWRSFFEE